MLAKPLELERFTTEIRKAGQVVGITDRIYPMNTSDVITFDDLLVRGDLTGPLEYNGHSIELVGIDSIIGLEVGMGGARGPVWKGVRCKVLT